jgi:Major intrinsic protein
MGEWQRYGAELLGTFVLVFVGSTAIVAALAAPAPVLLVAAFAFGLALLAGLYAFGEVSGGHFNPAVSLAMFLDSDSTEATSRAIGSPSSSAASSRRSCCSSRRLETTSPPPPPCPECSETAPRS